MKYFLMVTGLITIIILFGGIFFVKKNETNILGAASLPFPPTNFEYYWGDGCPHCTKVEEFFNSWDGDEKLNIDKKEVWNNAKNASLMAERAKACEISPTEMGVPLLVTPEGKCIGGDEPIISFFQNMKLE